MISSCGVFMSWTPDGGCIGEDLGKMRAPSADVGKLGFNEHEYAFATRCERQYILGFLLEGTLVTIIRTSRIEGKCNRRAWHYSIFLPKYRLPMIRPAGDRDSFNEFEIYPSY